jgi:hypothetical protein
MVNEDRLRDELLAAEMRFTWAMGEYEKIRIENENLKFELEKYRSIIGSNPNYKTRGKDNESNPDKT